MASVASPGVGRAQVMRKTSSEIIHDQTLMQGQQQRREYDRSRSGSGSSSGGSGPSESGACVTELQKKAACAKLRAISDGTSGESYPRSSIAEILASGGPSPICFTSSHNDIFRLDAWANACGLDGMGKIETLRNPGPQNKSSAPKSARPLVIGSRTTPTYRTTPREPPKPTVSPEVLASRRAERDKRVREHEEKLAEGEKDYLTFIDRRMKNSAPGRVKELAKEQSLTPALALERCGQGDAAACLRGEEMATSRPILMKVLEAACGALQGPSACADAERAARAVGDWAAHRRVAEQRCAKSKDPDSCAILARFHLGSPAWRAAWKWEKTGQSPEEGRRLALRACADQIYRTVELACADLVRAARDGLGGAPGFTSEEKALVKAACEDGRMSTDECAEADKVMSQKPEDVTKRRILDALDQTGGDGARRTTTPSTPSAAESASPATSPKSR